ncbi:hypothetical protein CROQUDRAFT_108167 [Cronartium quercuum f. sp. fusiforme G11]|uniref:Uncharacterized protein n=1 Tax=Cronartium quercuum f. sp. fusiforme G11 TaxID=708437 RepID=A0A9P6TAB4_9BASI|nr:hypothetical protein CROQUDRAFT_108167 [Cronartium quercuum f. sp. fusiforme G11]
MRKLPNYSTEFHWQCLVAVNSRELPIAINLIDLDDSLDCLISSNKLAEGSPRADVPHEEQRPHPKNLSNKRGTSLPREAQAILKADRPRCKADQWRAWGTPRSGTGQADVLIEERHDTHYTTGAYLGEYPIKPRSIASILTTDTPVPNHACSSSSSSSQYLQFVEERIVIRGFSVEGVIEVHLRGASDTDAQTWCSVQCTTSVENLECVPPKLHYATTEDALTRTARTTVRGCYAIKISGWGPPAGVTAIR